MKIVAFVPAKGESERVTSKNLRVLDGDHLFKRKLRQLLQCTRIDEVWLDTESDHIIELASDLPVKVLKRDPALANNETDGHRMFENQCNAVPDADIVVQVLCTAPFVGADTVDRAIEALLADSAADSLIAVQSATQYTWSNGKPDYGRGRVPNSVELERTIVETMSLYIMRKTSADFPWKRYGQAPHLFELSALEAVDINYPDDLQVSEWICAGQRNREAQYFRLLQHYLSSSILSDVTKELGLHCMLDPQIKLVTNGKMLGRVKTLRLVGLSEAGRDINKSDEWKGIYTALDSYNFVRSGDVIVVSTEVPDRAYFGDLNCHLALRSGAVGVLVDGFTRDVSSVAAMGMPVYARGAWSNDIKYEGTMAEMNKPIEVGGVSARNDDIIFADDEGALIVQAADWDAVLSAALEAVFNESKIRQGLTLGQPVEEIIESFGFF